MFQKQWFSPVFVIKTGAKIPHTDKSICFWGWNYDDFGAPQSFAIGLGMVAA